MASNGVDVSANHQLPLGGAEPLSHRQLQVGPPGHYDDDRPSRIYARFSKNIAADDEKIAIAEDVQKRKAEEEIRSVALGEG